METEHPNRQEQAAPVRPRIGISTCLLGKQVRFDGGHKRDAFLTDLLGEFVQWVPVCPEVEAGLGTPRPAMRLVREGDRVRMVETRSGRDWTERMEAFTAHRVPKLEALELSGYIFKKDSPSCGMTRVKIYPPQGDDKGMPQRDGVGLYAKALMDRYPNLPVEDEGRLKDAHIRENFIERLFAYHRLRSAFAPGWTNRDLIAFHTAHKLQLMAHSPSAYREAGRLVASLKDLPRTQFQADYERIFMSALRQIASRGRNANVLQHAAGFLKTKLDSPSRTELAGLIDEYRDGLVPLVVPLTLIGHHVRRQSTAYLRDQFFLDPHPKQLMLRNHV